MTSTAPTTNPATAGVLDPPLDGAPTRDVELAIEGMTCAACAVRIEKKLNRLDDVRASVNYATGTARVTGPAGMETEELIAAVVRAGYTATAPASEWDVPVETLNLSVRSFNCLKRAGISKISELLDMTEDEIIKMRNFGKKSLDEIKQVLEERGLSLRL